MVLFFLSLSITENYTLVVFLILPEVFLKAVTVARNLGYKIRNFTTANFDMISQYRPYQNILSRPTSSGGKGYSIIGHHEIMIPLLYRAIIEEI